MTAYGAGWGAHRAPSVDVSVADAVLSDLSVPPQNTNL